jgi:hypothetical protein
LQQLPPATPFRSKSGIKMLTRIYFAFIFAATISACGTGKSDSQIATDSGPSDGPASQRQQAPAPKDPRAPQGKVVEAEAIRYERDCAANRSVIARCYQAATNVAFGPAGRTFRDATDTEIEHQDVIIRKKYENGVETFTPVGWGAYYPEEEDSYRSGDVRVVGRKPIKPADLPRVEQRIRDTQQQYPEDEYSALGGLDSSGWNCQEMANGVWRCIP